MVLKGGLPEHDAYRQIERTWLIRRTALEPLLPVAHGDGHRPPAADFHRVR
jgi:hypothetical protein